LIFTGQLLEPRQRGVEVRLVEYFAAVDPVAFDSQKVDHSPLGVEAFRRSPMQRIGGERAETAETMHRLDAHGEVWRDVPNGPHGCVWISRVDDGEVPVVDSGPVRRG